MKAESNVKLTALEITVFIISWIAAIITNHKSEKYTGTEHGVSVRNVNSSLIKTVLQLLDILYTWILAS